MLIAPCPIEALDFAEATVGTPCGDFASGWRREGSGLVFTVTVPPNASAIVRLPGQDALNLGPGTYTRTLPFCYNLPHFRAASSAAAS